MEVTVTRPEELDLSNDAEVELNSKVDIAARMAGYRSRREYEIAAKYSLVKQFYPAQPAPREKKASK